MVLLSIVLLITLISLASCNKAKDKLYQDVTLEVFNLNTGDKIEENKTYRFEYDGTPKVFDVKVKLDETGKYLEDKDFENNDWKSHIELLIQYEGEDAYKDYNENGKLDWQKDWPMECGTYAIKLAFNSHGWFADIEDDNRYIRTWFCFTIEIV